MAGLGCPGCGQVIADEDVNVASDVAYCRGCHRPHVLHELARGSVPDRGDAGDPPPGVRVHRDGRGLVIEATHASLGGAVGALLVTLFWNGVTAVFVSFAAAATLQVLQLPAPAWMPAPVWAGHTEPVGPWMTLGLWCFLAPFLWIGAGLALRFLSLLAGFTEVILGPAEGTVRSAIGPFGWSWRFDPRTVTALYLEPPVQADGARPGATHVVLVRRGARDLRLGSLLTQERKRYLAAVLRRELLAGEKDATAARWA